MSWTRAVDTRLRDLCERVGLEQEIADPFIGALLALGPWGRTERLRHDVLLPKQAEQLSINVFGVGELDVRALCAQWAGDVLGEGPTAALDSLCLPGVDWHAGVLFREGEVKLKLYLTGRLESAATVLGVARPTPIRALGVDVDATGLKRPRSYHELPAGAPYLRDWAEDLLQIDTPPLRLVTVLEGKRTLNLIYEQGAPLQAAEASGFEANFGLARQLGARPSALEIDVYPTHRDTDLLVFFGEELG